jgi:hypothetical protein
LKALERASNKDRKENNKNGADEKNGYNRV